MTEPPEIQQTTISCSQIQILLNEILEGDSGALVRTRDDPSDRPLRDHTAPARIGHMQIRYAHDGISWIDTIMPIGADIAKLIRVPNPQPRGHSQMV